VATRDDEWVVDVDGELDLLLGRGRDLDDNVKVSSTDGAGHDVSGKEEVALADGLKAKKTLVVAGENGVHAEGSLG
jgi:hypothetical protein